jgi:hypothetical protein
MPMVMEPRASYIALPVKWTAQVDAAASNHTQSALDKLITEAVAMSRNSHHVDRHIHQSFFTAECRFASTLL